MAQSAAVCALPIWLKSHSNKPQSKYVLIKVTKQRGKWKSGEKPNKRWHHHPALIFTI